VTIRLRKAASGSRLIETVIMALVFACLFFAPTSGAEGTGRTVRSDLNQALQSGAAPPEASRDLTPERIRLVREIPIRGQSTLKRPWTPREPAQPSSLISSR